MESETRKKTKQNRHILVFSDNCCTCKEHIDNVLVGKCAGCILEIIDVRLNKNKVLLEEYSIDHHPTTIIDNLIKIDGVPDFYWQCGDEFYKRLQSKFPLQYRNIDSHVQLL